MGQNWRQTVQAERLHGKNTGGEGAVRGAQGEGGGVGGGDGWGDGRAGPGGISGEHAVSGRRVGAPGRSLHRVGHGKVNHLKLHVFPFPPEDYFF